LRLRTPLCCANIDINHFKIYYLTRLFHSPLTGTTLCSQDRIRTCTSKWLFAFATESDRRNLPVVHPGLLHNPHTRIVLNVYQFRHLTILRLRTPLCRRELIL
jgi:hypothetical protein